ncbi:MAG: GNAT family N-acetyltransferase [Flavobacteriaceae bacterium]
MKTLNVETSPVLETERLKLRKVTLEDANEVFFLRSDKVVGKYIARNRQQTIEEAEDFIKARQEDIAQHKLSHWAITIKGDDTLVGSICLWNFTKNNTVAEVGYDLNPAFQKKGIMNEALGLVLSFGFNKLNFSQIEAFTQKQNQSSVTLLKRNAFKQHPTRIDEGFPKNIIFELTQEDYNKVPID